MNDEMKEKMKKIATDMGVPEDAMSDEMMWGMKKAMWGGSMMMKAMMDGGMDEDKAMDTMKKFSDMMMSPLAMEESKKMMSDMEEKKDHGDWKDKDHCKC